VELLLLAGFSQQGNMSKPDNHANLLGLMGLYKFTEGKYQEAVAMYLDAYELSGNVIFLSQLARYQIRFKEFKHAEKIIGMIEKINDDRFGIETYTVKQLSAALAEARKEDTSTPELQTL
jgi:hypothetical protein